MLTKLWKTQTLIPALALKVAHLNFLGLFFLISEIKMLLELVCLKLNVIFMLKHFFFN